MSDLGSFEEGLDVQYEYRFFLNGSSPVMSINGSSSPIDFVIAPSTKRLYVSRLDLFLFDNGTPAPTEFADIAALSQGLLLSVRSKGVEGNFVNLRNNIDVALVFSAAAVPSSTAAWMDNNDWYLGACQLPKPILLRPSDGDFIRFRVRDNLSGIDHVKAGALCWSEIA